MKRKKSFPETALLFSALLILMVGAAFWSHAWAASHGPASTDGVRVVTGPSPIEGDVLNHPDDITLYNEHLALTLAVGSPNFWGMTNGSISNLAVMQGPDTFGVNIINDVEFLVNSWTATGGSLKAEATITHNTPEKGAVQAVSTWLGEGKTNALEVVSTYTLEKNSPVVTLQTRVFNPGPDTYTDLKSGYSMSGLAAFMFGPFGYHTPDVRAKNIHVGKNAGEPFGDFVVSYTKGYAVTLQMDDTQIYRGTTGYKDLHHNYDLAPGESRTFAGELQVIPRGDTTAFMARMIEKKSLAWGEVSGVVAADDGKPYSHPVVVVEREGRFKGSFDGSQNLPSEDLHVQIQPFIWHVGEADGSFSFRLPEGDYRIYADAPGYTASPAQSVGIRSGGNITLSFTRENAIVRGGRVVLTVTDKDTGKPVDARIEVEGPVPAVKYLGARTFFTALNPVGQAAIPLPVGEFAFKVMSGAHFFSLPETVTATVASGQEQPLSAAVQTRIQPRKEQWYSVDLHHHTDIGDGSTSPEDLVKSQLAGHLDLIFVSDHDSVENHASVKSFADARRIGMIPSLEVSPGWGHLNILPMPLGGEIIAPAMTVGEIIAKAHAGNGLVIVNHPYTDYGYFNNREIVPGGYDNNFDLIELQPTLNLSKPKNADTKTLAAAMALWSDHAAGKAKAYYLTGGSDTHDVASPTLYSGMMRTFARVEGEFGPAGFIQAVAQGKSYASMGPLFFTKEIHFGDRAALKSGEEMVLELEAFAVNGLDTVELYTGGTSIGSPADVVSFDGSVKKERVPFTVAPKESTWYSFIARDKAGKPAISNPVWIDVTP